MTAKRKRIVGVAAIALVAAAVAVWLLYDRMLGDGPAEVADPQLVAGFHASLAALDVEENERAARVLGGLVAAEPREPALWANLAVAQLRLNEPTRARDSLQRALELAPRSPELALLSAQALEHAGETELAIQQLRDVHRQWPENVAATFSLVSLLEQIRSDEAETERLTLLNDILDRAPGNLRALVEKARVAATLQRGDELREALDALQSTGQPWPEAAQQQLTQADQAQQTGDFRQAALALTFFENLLKPRREYQQSLAQLGTASVGAVGTPLRSLLRLDVPPVEAAEADLQMTFELQDAPATAVQPDLVVAIQHHGEPSSTLVTLANNAVHAGASAEVSFPGSSSDAVPSSVCAADVNADFRQDLICVGTEGCRIYLGAEDGSFALLPSELEEFGRSWRSVWAVDVEADGDMDLLLSDHQTPLRWIRNNGDASFTAVDAFLAAEKVVDLQIADFDRDGDIDLATLDGSGSIAVWRNRRGGVFVATTLARDDRRLGITVGDIDRDGQLELISIGQSGQLYAARWETEDHWPESQFVTRSPTDALSSVRAGDVFLTVADVDNNGGVDVVVSRDAETAIWLRTADASWALLGGIPDMRVTSVVDRNGDGLLDLIGISDAGQSVAVNRSQTDYGWHVIEPMATTADGDKRINSFGVGGRIELRAGSLVQTAAIQSPRVHFGLGRHERADVARIIWPNGTVQAEFDLASRESLVAKQRLKGSCPWVFTFDGQDYRFVKDFIWRSPLGLRINAQSTAGVVQTEDWIKIPGDLLKAVDGRYQVRITAELWETHFFDHVSLLAVDHPADVEVFVDERFVPQEMPAQQVIATTRLRSLRNLISHRGRQLDDVLQADDGIYSDGFSLGTYQGVAEEHWVAFSLPDDVATDRALMLVGHGWIYPTDSSLNVALDQGAAARPQGLVLEQLDAAGDWTIVRDGLGFPSGKNKNVVIQLPVDRLSVSRRFRLRTNLEIYWDSLRWSYAVDDVQPRVKQLATEKADLRYRGFSRLLPLDRRRPDTPVYEVASTQQQWLDLEGYYTRFGDVRELLQKIDDRYVIMNAGDELVLEFAAGDAPPEGWHRDFVLIGDGWVKDGDFNTAFSQWVRPLPTHTDADYSGPLLPLEHDPVYLRHPDDWRTFHTRYVTPDHFQRGLWGVRMPPSNEEARQ